MPDTDDSGASETDDGAENETTPNEGDLEYWKAEAAKWQGLSRKNEDRAKSNADKAKQLDALSREKLSDAERHAAELDAAREEARAEARAEAARETGRRLAAAEVKAVAAALLANPEDAVAFLDVASFVDDDGEFDAKAVKAAVDKLVKDRPYLAASTNRTPVVPAGARNSSPKRSPAEAFAAAVEGHFGR